MAVRAAIAKEANLLFGSHDGHACCSKSADSNFSVSSITAAIPPDVPGAGPICRTIFGLPPTFVEANDAIAVGGFSRSDMTQHFVIDDAIGRLTICTSRDIDVVR